MEHVVHAQDASCAAKSASARGVASSSQAPVIRADISALRKHEVNDLQWHPGSDSV
jgi:hypothetical protein